MFEAVNFQGMNRQVDLGKDSTDTIYATGTTGCRMRPDN